MRKVICDMSMSVDGVVAGPNQSLANPFGEGVGDRLHRVHVRGARDERRGDPGRHGGGSLHHGPQHVRPWPRRLGPGVEGLVGRRAALPRAGLCPDPPSAPDAAHERGTAFSFVTDGIESALAQAGKAAGEDDIAIARAGAPGRGERLFDGVGDPASRPPGGAGTRAGRLAGRPGSGPLPRRRLTRNALGSSTPSAAAPQAGRSLRRRRR
jgi:hypothetical protein